MQAGTSFWTNVKEVKLQHQSEGDEDWLHQTPQKIEVGEMRDSGALAVIEQPPWRNVE